MNETPTYKRVVAAITNATRSLKSIAEAACTCERNAAKIVKHLHETEQIHVARWERGHSGPFKPIYRWGKGTDAVRPAPLSSAEKCKRYRISQRKRHGKNYGAIHAAQKKRVPGRKIVIDGQVVYQQ